MELNPSPKVQLFPVIPLDTHPERPNYGSAFLRWDDNRKLPQKEFRRFATPLKRLPCFEKGSLIDLYA
jgi:hypothetical protein